MPYWMENLNWWSLLDFYFIYIFVLIVLKFILHNKRVLSIFMFYIFSLIILWIAKVLGLPLSVEVYGYLPLYFLIFLVVIAAPDIRLTLDSLWKERVRVTEITMGSDHTKNEILEAVKKLAKTNTGALITIEKHNILDQYAERAIILNSDVSNELLINIFTPNTPMHDGAVIIRGDKIICAGAYYILSSNDAFDKTTGSRHRAALGISEITDSLTVVVSEETGSVSIAINGVMTKMRDENTLDEYLSLFMK